MSLNIGIFQSLSKEDKALKKALHNILGFRPKFMPYYVMAITHRSSKSDAKLNNERLEFLGDAFIGSIVGEYLFKKYPTQDEGYLTEMRSKIVSRTSLNNVALKMGLQKLVRYNHQDKVLKRSHIFGNAFEALVGAIYLDKGYATTNAFIKNKLIGTYLDIDELEITEFNFKNKLYTWAQKNHYQMDFNLVSEKFEAGRKVFKVAIMVNEQLFTESTGYSKKEASQTAAQKALELIEQDAAPQFQPISTPEVKIENNETPSNITQDNLLTAQEVGEDTIQTDETIEATTTSTLTEVASINLDESTNENEGQAEEPSTSNTEELED